MKSLIKHNFNYFFIIVCVCIALATMIVFMAVRVDAQTPPIVIETSAPMVLAIEVRPSVWQNFCIDSCNAILTWGGIEFFEVEYTSFIAGMCGYYAWFNQQNLSVIRNGAPIITTGCS